ncbi:MAG: hypothetical protein M1821_007399 [Bathelium mastoideum]|nr:MAG: hypothetical protein M1821_007399 [Bathelium mastoideum]
MAANSEQIYTGTGLGLVIATSTAEPEDIHELFSPGSPPSRPPRTNIISAREKRMTKVEKEQKEIKSVLSRHNPRASEYMNGLGMEVMAEFLESRDTHSLHQAISFFQNAVELTPKGYLDRDVYLSNLASALGKRVQRNGDAKDAGKVIKYRSEALLGIGTDNLDFVKYISDLADGIHARYSLRGHMFDLTEAFELLQYTLKIHREHDPQHIVILERLAAVYRDLSARTDKMAHLQKSLKYIRHAMSLASKFRSQPKFSHICTLASILRQKYNITGKIRQLDRAIDCSREALELASNDCDRKAEVLGYLGLMLQQRASISMSTVDLDNGIDCTRYALSQISDESPHRTTFLYHLGTGYRDQFEKGGQLQDLDASTEAFEKSFASLSGSLHDRLLAGLGAFQNLVSKEIWNRATDLGDAIIQFLPKLVPLSATRQDLQFFLDNLSGFASLSASVFLKAGKPPSFALEALETSRGVISSRLMDTKFEQPELMERFPDYYKSYKRLRESVSLSTDDEGRFEPRFRDPLPVCPNLQFGSFRSEDIQKRIDQVDQITNTIRRLPGFERFLLPLTQRQIQELSREGPIISLNVSHIGSEAFVITATNFDVIPLPSLQIEGVKRCIKLFASKGNIARRDAALCADDDDVAEYVPDLRTELESLWVNAVRPILQKLGLLSLRPSPSSLPRVWWVGSGITSLLPLHAAGKHDPGSIENTLSHVISSYISSLKTLNHLRRKLPFTIHSHKAEVLVVSMPTSPGHLPLEVTGEVEAVLSRTESWASAVCLERAPKRRVLQALKSCTLVHFACHGALDPVNPEQSSLIVGREAEERLSVKDLDSINNKNFKIAYLSACSTAEIGLNGVADESINLANSFQLAEFQHVIGTLWGADDDAAAQIASLFYPALLRLKDKNNASVAQALHEAVIQYRNSEGKTMEPSKWAPFIHLGC